MTITQCMVCNGGGSFHRVATAGLPGSVSEASYHNVLPMSFRGGGRDRGGEFCPL